MESQAATIEFGTCDGGLYLGACGRATQRVSPTADKVVSDYLATRPDQPVVVLDLDGCDWVDSTFAGWMVALKRRLAQMRGGRLTVARCGERCHVSLDRMCLDDMFEYADVARPAETQHVRCEGSDRPDRATLEFMLKAHEELAALNEQNRAVFGPIAEMLRRQLEKP